MISESAVLSSVMDQTRTLSKLYLNLLTDVDLHKTFEVEGKALNSVFWIIAHLSVTENFLLLRSTGAEHVKIPWARQFGLGSTPSTVENSPPLDEVRSVFEEVHTKSMNHISKLDDSFLDQLNTSGFTFFDVSSVRSTIVHAIRHEGTHAGHLGWLCKLHGIKTI